MWASTDVSETEARLAELPSKDDFVVFGVGLCLCRDRELRVPVAGDEKLLAFEEDARRSWLFFVFATDSLDFFEDRGSADVGNVTQ